MSSVFNNYDRLRQAEWVPNRYNAGLEELRGYTNPPAESLGENNDLVALGGQESLVLAKSGTDLNMKTLIAGSGITFTPGAQTLEIESTGGSGEINTASNVGAGVGVFKQKVLEDLEFKSIIAETPLIVASNVDDITLGFDPPAASSILYSGTSGTTSNAPLISNTAGLTTFDLSAGELFIFDYSTPGSPTGTAVIFPMTLAIPGTLLNMPSVAVTYVSIDAAGTIFQESSPPNALQGITRILIGNIDHTTPGFATFTSPPTASPLTAYNVADLARVYLGQKGGINLEGMLFSGRGDLAVQNSLGLGIRLGANYTTDSGNPNYPVGPSANPSTVILEFYTDVSQNLIVNNVGVIDPTQFNLNGVLTNVNPTSRWMIFHCFFAYGSNTTAIYKGGTQYADEATALANVNTDSFLEHPNTLVFAPRGWILAQGNHTTTNQMTFVAGPNERGITTSGMVTSSTATLQSAYDSNSFTTLSSGPSTWTIQDAGTPLGTDLFSVRDNSGASSLAVAANSVTIKRLLVAATTSNGIQLDPFGPASGDSSELRFLEPSSFGTEYVGFKAPDSITSSQIWSLPNATGSPNDVLTLGASNTTSWASSNGSSITTSNSGGGAGLALARATDDFPFKSLVAGSNITLNASGTEIEIVASGGGGGSSTYLHVESTSSNAVVGNTETSPVANNSSITANTSDLTYTVSTGVVNIISDGIYTFSGMVSMLQNLVPPGGQGTTFCLFWRSGVTSPSGTGGRCVAFNEQNWLTSATGNGEKHYSLNWTGFLSASDTMRLGVRHDDTVTQSTLSNQNLGSSDPRLTEFFVTKHG